jgi:hypothetical protein
MQWWGIYAYLIIDIPAPVHASLLCLVATLVDTEMPIHMRRFLFPSLLICLEPSSTLVARKTQLFVKL